MIVSKPKISTLFSITVFLFLAFGLFVYSLVQVNQTTQKLIWMILIYTSGPIGLVVLIKTLFGYRIVKIGKERFEVHYPFKFSKIKFEGKEIEGWKHNMLKTFGGVYEDITWRLKSGKEYSLSRQEHTEYEKALKYMRKKYKKTEVK